jgi:hypothetical protein
MAMQKFPVPCPRCKRENTVDVQAMIWARLTPHGTSELADQCSHEWDDSSAACGWKGMASDIPIASNRASGRVQWEPTIPSARLSCPAGHTNGLQESHEVHVWFAIDATTGEADYTIALGDLEAADIDEEAVSDGYFYCPTCNDTFSELLEITEVSEQNRSA